MIVDCFTFYNEFDLLELRLRVLEDVVERFVLVQAPFTFRGDAKPLHFDLADPRFARWRDRITMLVHEGPPDPDPWQNEWRQRDRLIDGLQGCAPGDVILIGDCDEIPDPRYVELVAADGGILAHMMLFSQGYVNRLGRGAQYAWPGTRAVRYEDVARFGGITNVRRTPVNGVTQHQGGWHFTTLGGGAVMAEKMRTYSHHEYDIRYLNDRRRLDVSFAGGAEMWFPYDDRFPAAMRADSRWDAFVWERPPVADTPLKPALEHAHGCLAYAPADAAAVAVIASDPLGWAEAGPARFGGQFLGVFPDAGSLPGGPVRPWIFVDGLAELPASTLAELAAAGLRAALHGRNARSIATLQNVLSGYGGFPPGSPHGRREFEGEIVRCGYRIAGTDRVFNGMPIPRNVTSDVENIAVGSFTFPRMTAAALYDFVSDAFIFELEPA